MWSKGQLLIFFLFLLVQVVLLYLILLPMLCSSPPLREQRTDKELVGWLHEQQRRKSKVATTCASDLAWMEENWQRSPNNKQGHFLYNQDHNILGCLQPKVRHGLDLCQWVSQQSQSWKCKDFETISLPNGNVFQVGSTTWLRHFLSLTNTSQRKELNKFERDTQASMMAFLYLCICICTQASMMAPTDPDIINLARASLSFSMVRHPFERIVSAYKDKVISRTF